MTHMYVGVYYAHDSATGNRRSHQLLIHDIQPNNQNRLPNNRPLNPDELASNEVKSFEVDWTRNSRPGQNQGICVRTIASIEFICSISPTPTPQLSYRAEHKALNRPFKRNLSVTVNTDDEMDRAIASGNARTLLKPIRNP